MDSTVSKLILLYVFDQMEIPVTAETLNEMCCSQNNWLSYMTLTEALPELVDARFLATTGNGNSEYYKITQEGRNCVSYFFMKVPSSIRDEIRAFIRKNRQTFKRKQEYFKDYFKNKDGTYTVRLKITDPTSTKLEIVLNVANRAEATTVYKKWDNAASEVYGDLYKILIDGE
ncbi:MAG: DUF4364 family protein [Clostridia bacterium]|nr:DUF4364 family protein [Clostridia bacterium]